MASPTSFKVELVSFSNFEAQNPTWQVVQPAPEDPKFVSYTLIMTTLMTLTASDFDIETTSPTLGYSGLILTLSDDIMKKFDAPAGDQVYLTPSYASLLKKKKLVAPAGVVNTLIYETLIISITVFATPAVLPIPPPLFYLPVPAPPTPLFFPDAWVKQFTYTKVGIDKSEPPSGPQVKEWGGQYADINNSYNYACNVRNEDQTKPSAQPGGNPLTPDKITADSIKQLALGDGLVEVDDPKKGPPSGSHLVALFVYPKVDHYWVRLNATGGWSHMPQSGRVSFDDYRDVNIKDPKYSDFDQYRFVGYMAAKSSLTIK